MQNERNVLTTERFEEPRQSDVFVPLPYCVERECGCVTPPVSKYNVVRELGKENAPAMLRLAPGHSHSHTSLAGGNDNVKE